MELIRKASLPPVSTETVSAAGNLIAVLVSPECIILSGIVKSLVEVIAPVTANVPTTLTPVSAVNLVVPPAARLTVFVPPNIPLSLSPKCIEGAELLPAVAAKTPVKVPPAKAR